MIEEDMKILEELLQHCRDTQDYSYYNLRAYVFENCPQYNYLFQKRIRAECIASLLKAEMKRAGLKYGETKLQAYERFVTAAAGRGEYR